MSAATQVSEQLPYLRRFARALTGSQASGDNYVAALLEVIVADATILADMKNVKVGLFRSLLQMWSSLKVNTTVVDIATSPGAAERNLQAIAPLPRQAFLLESVEGFSREEIGSVLEISSSEVDALIEEASRDIAAQVATSVLIIEDEPLIAMDIEMMVTDIGHRVTKIARTHNEAVAAIDVEKPGIVLADIQLADGSSGVDAVNEILTKIDVPVIFITAYPERLLTGERPEPAYLVTKPFQPSTVAALISQALFFDDNTQAAA